MITDRAIHMGLTDAVADDQADSNRRHKASGRGLHEFIMARPRTPTAIQELKGAYKKDPQRWEARVGEPHPEGPLGAAPFGFDEELEAIWREIEEMVPARVLTIADRWVVELACRTMRDVRAGRALASERNLLLSCLSRMGLTPADRSRIAVLPKQTSEIDELALLAAEGKASHVLKPN